MEPSVTIRRAVPSDAQALAELHLRSAREGFRDIFLPEYLATSRREELAGDWLARLQPDQPSDQIVLVAEVNGAMVGVLVAGSDPLDPTIGRLSRHYVDRQFWGRGVRRRLVSEAIAYLRDLGCTVVMAWIMERNHQARALAHHLGWTCTGERQPTCEQAASVPAGVHDLRYQLLLTPSTDGGQRDTDRRRQDSPVPRDAFASPCDPQREDRRFSEHR
jgi:GNAT superfamily N-acetyltransferase